MPGSGWGRWRKNISALVLLPRPGRERPAGNAVSLAKWPPWLTSFNEARHQRPGGDQDGIWLFSEEPSFTRPGRKDPGTERRSRGPITPRRCFNEARARRPGSGRRLVVITCCCAPLFHRGPGAKAREWDEDAVYPSSPADPPRSPLHRAPGARRPGSGTRTAFLRFIRRSRASMRPGREDPGVGARDQPQHAGDDACFNEAEARRPGNGTPISTDGQFHGLRSFNEAQAQPREASGLDDETLDASYGGRGACDRCHRAAATTLRLVMRPGREDPGVRVARK